MCSRGDEASSCLSIDSLLPALLFGISTLVFEALCWRVGGGLGEELVAGRRGLLSGVITVELVAGRDRGDDVP